MVGRPGRHRRAASVGVAVVGLVASLVASTAVSPRPASALSATDFTVVTSFAVSPTRSELAFSVPPNPFGEPAGLYVADRDGTDARSVADQGSFPDFSPDGSRLVFSRPDAGGAGDIAVVDLGTGTTSSLTSTPDDDVAARFAPDGQSVVVTSNAPDGTPSVFVLDLVSGARTDVPTRGGAQSASFSADGTAALVSDRDDLGALQIFAVPLAGGPATQLTHFDAGHDPVGAEASRAPSTTGQIVMMDDGRVETMNADGSGLSELTTTITGSSTQLQDVHWTPAGRVAYLWSTIPPPSPPPTGPPPTTSPSPTVTPSTLPPASGPQAHLVIPPDPATGTVPPGGSLSTGADATALQPLATTATSPTGGALSIDTTPVDVSPPAGYSLLGQQVLITAPAASPSAPIILEFRIDASLLADAGVTPATVVVLRDGVPMPDCDPAGAGASPDPCVAGRAALPDGDADLTVRTSHASRWNFAAGPPVVAHATSTAVACSPASVVVAQPTTCTVTVTDLAASGVSSPAGAVTSTTDEPSGSFPGGPTCTLAPGPTTGTAACSVSYAVSRVAAGPRTDTISSAFTPADAHQPSAGSTTVTVGLRPVAVTVSCTPPALRPLRWATACTVAVTDGAGAGSPSRPAGAVRVTTADRRAEVDPRSCALTPAGPSRPTTATCTVRVTEPPGLLGSRSDTVTASFTPDTADSGVHAGGTGSTTLVVRGLVR